MNGPHTRMAVVHPEEGEPWSAFEMRLSNMKGEILIILAAREKDLIEHGELCEQLLNKMQQMRHHIYVAAKQKNIIDTLEQRGIRTIHSAKDIKKLLANHGKLEEALRLFSPHSWKQDVKSRLQEMGLLSLPKLRIFILVLVSACVFFFIVFRLLPSADVEVWPRTDTINQAMNLYLVQSGATVGLPSHVDRLPLLPVTVNLTQSLTINHVRKESIGTPSRLIVNMINETDEPVALMRGTRISNQAGMIFRIEKKIFIMAKSSTKVSAVADDTDIYDEIIGARGNVPVGLKWQIPGLNEEEQKKIYAENVTEGQGGTTTYRTVLKDDDIKTAKLQLERELETAAQAEIERIRKAKSLIDDEKSIRFILLPKLIAKSFANFQAPTDLIGKEVSSFTVSESITYTVLSYDGKTIVGRLAEELLKHVREGKKLIGESIVETNLDIRVIYYDDNLSWVKITADLTGTERYDLDPLSPTGAMFAKNVRERIAGLHYQDALRIVKNLPQVDEVRISLWPPFSSRLPSIPSHIGIFSR